MFIQKHPLNQMCKKAEKHGWNTLSAWRRIWIYMCTAEQHCEWRALNEMVWPRPPIVTSSSYCSLLLLSLFRTRSLSATATGLCARVSMCTCMRRLTGMYMHASDCAAHMNEHTFCTCVCVTPASGPWNKPAEPSEGNGVRLAVSTGLNLPIIPKTCLPPHKTALHPNHGTFQHLMTYVITCVCMSCTSIWSVSLCMFSSACERVMRAIASPVFTLPLLLLSSAVKCGLFASVVNEGKPRSMPEPLRDTLWVEQPHFSNLAVAEARIWNYLINSLEAW